MRYLVTWEIDIDADTPEEAARKALAIQRNPDSIATIFDVVRYDSNDMFTRVDITELEEQSGIEDTSNCRESIATGDLTP
jgi:hypothetical protein